MNFVDTFFDKSGKILSMLYGFISKGVSKLYDAIQNNNVFKRIAFAFIIMLLFMLMFYAFLFDPYKITTKIPLLFLSICIVYIIGSFLFFTLWSDDVIQNLDLSYYTSDLLYTIFYLVFCFIVFCILYYISKFVLLDSTPKSILLTTCFITIGLSIIYSIQKKNMTSNNDAEVNQNKVLQFIKDVLFLIPCFLVDMYEFLVKDIQQAPSSTVTFSIGIVVMLSLFYIVPYLQKMKYTKPNVIFLQDKAVNLEKEVIYLDHNDLKEKIIQSKPFVERNILTMNQYFEKRLNSIKGRKDPSISKIHNSLEHQLILTHSDNNDGTMSYTAIKDISNCIGKEVTCENDYIQCGNWKVSNDLGIHEKCLRFENGSIFSTLFKPQQEMSMYKNQEKQEKQTFVEYCGNKIGSKSLQVRCIDISNNYDDISWGTNGDYSYDNSGMLHDKHLYACDKVNVSRFNEESEEKKYHIISGYNDICNNETPFECKNQKTTMESFVSAHNPRLHRLDENVKEWTFLSMLSQEEKDIIDRSIQDTDSNFSEKMRQLDEQKDKELLILEYLSNSTVYSNILQNIYILNQNTTDYLTQETSKLITLINSANQIYDYNYHYGISFWVYFDPEIMKLDTGNTEGMILNYAYTPYIYYHYHTKELIIEINNCKKDLLSLENVSCKQRDVIYRSKNILFQRWNHFVVNYNYGVLDIFINNNLVLTQENVSPYIQEGTNYIQFGSNEKPLNHCGLCAVQYHTNPLKLKEIKKLYEKKNNPCN